ncbi:MAG: Hpt domain-containing protein [Ruminococcus sp.]|jgi:HPt (histidine-containing phosphotransfer) domain-containing protein|nr:Hpt domain-containing protein [Ruminococcus sp.]MBQ4247714.1 Hpt domain-containing protein [Ruminococcus sp.]
MLTTDKLRQFGANVDEGLMRCMNKEDFYIMLVEKVRQDSKLDILEKQLAHKDLDGAFDTAHTLKGMYSNLSLTPLTEPVSRMTELLRSKTDTDYSALLNEAKAQFEKLCAL